MKQFLEVGKLNNTHGIKGELKNATLVRRYKLFKAI